MDVKSMDATDVVFGVALTFLVLSVLSAPWVRRHIGGVAQVCRRSVCALVLGLCRASPLPSRAHLSSVTLPFSCVTAVAVGASPVPYTPLPSPTCTHCGPKGALVAGVVCALCLAGHKLIDGVGGQGGTCTCLTPRT
jgi:hypothetical protein